MAKGKKLEVDQELELEHSEEKLSAKQELFCQTFATKGALFGNGVQTYIEVYDPDQGKPNWYKTACASASRMLSNVKLINRINQLLEDHGLNDVEVDKQHRYLIEQHTDLGVKMRAIDSYNKVKQRIVEKKEYHITGTGLIGLSTEELLKMKETGEKDKKLNGSK